MTQGVKAGLYPIAIGEPQGIDEAMNGFLKRELPSSAYQRHFEFHRKGDGEIVELITHPGFKGTIPGPSVLVNAHVSPRRKGAQLIANELVVVG
jgi:hypothetical protein